MKNLVKTDEPFDGGYFKFTDYGEDVESAKIWLEDMIPGVLYRIVNVQTDEDFYAKGPSGEQWIATDCLDMHKVTYELFVEEPEDVN